MLVLPVDDCCCTMASLMPFIVSYRRERNDFPLIQIKSYRFTFNPKMNIALFSFFFVFLRERHLVITFVHCL